MQSLVQTRTIRDEKRFVILDMLADKYSRAILESTRDHPKSAVQIATENNIPTSSVYRRLQTLYNNKILSISGSISDDGKKYFLYKSRIKEVFVSYSPDGLTVELVPAQ